jgi:hypothetical protein
VEELSPTLKHIKGFSFINLREVNSKFSREKRNLYSQVEELSPTLKVQTDVALILQPFFSPDGLVAKSLEFAATQVSFQYYFQQVVLKPLAAP